MNFAGIYTNGRREFSGAADKYALRTKGTLSAALNGDGPLNIAAYFNNSDYNDVTSRIERYQEADKFYNGIHWKLPMYKNEKKPVYNFCETVVDKGLSFYVGKGTLFRVPAGETRNQQILDEVWKNNSKDSMLGKLIVHAIMLGDSCVYLSPMDTDAFGRELPRKKRGVKLKVIHPGFVYPVWDHGSTTQFPSRCLMQYKSVNERGEDFMYSLMITPEKFDEYHNTEQVSSVPNELGFVPVVMFHNGAMQNSRFGRSDIASIIPLNIKFNKLAWSVERTIHYHAEPTTLVFGARVSTIERGAEKVWSNLPVEARVENLELKGNMALASEQLKATFDSICHLSETPAFLFDPTDMRISNTSGIALRTMCFPIITKTERRKQGFSESFKLLHLAIFRAWEVYRGETLDTVESDVEIEYSDILPQDENAELDAGIKRVEIGVWSKAELIRRLSHVKDLERLRIELIADEVSKLALQREKAMALLGGVFSEKSASLDSFSLTGEDSMLGD